MGNSFTPVVVVVGGSGGIGWPTAETFASRGCSVVIADQVDNRPKDSKIEFLEVDVMSPKSISNVALEVKNSYGRLTHLISMAGGALGSEFGLFKNLTQKEISDSIDLNLKSHVYLLQAFEEILIEDRNTNKSVTFVSSINSIRDYGLIPYSTSKAGLNGLMISASNHFGRQNVRINVVSPGTVPTPRTSNEPKDFKNLEENSIMGRLATAQEVASTIVSLSLDLVSIVAQNLIIDCGQIYKSNYKNLT